jgi:hypothetical protein
VTRALRVLAWASCLLPMAAGAGRTCEEHPLDARAVAFAVELAQRVESELDQAQAQAVVLGRIGSDLSQYGLRYSHAGLAHRERETRGWTVLHKLNHCGSDRAELFEQGLANFFLDDPWEYRALVLEPLPDLQRRLLLAVDRGVGDAVDEPRYCVIADPYSRVAQNSNGWLLELIALAEIDAAPANRAIAQERLRRTAYRPDVIAVGSLQRLAAVLFKANVIFTDHPLRERLSGRYSIVSVESIERHLSHRGLLAAKRELALP